MQRDRVDGADDGPGLIVEGDDGLLAVGGKGLDAALAAEEHHPLVKDRQSAAELRAGEGLGRNAVEIRAVHGVIAPVEADGLDIDVDV